MTQKYDHQRIEKKWQERWEREQPFAAKDASDKQKLYVLDMFPYPSGEGLHVGHPKGYIATDIYSRYKRMQGCNVLHPMGWDAFGLPAENYAIANKVHPRAAVEKNIAYFKEQLAHIGFDYDWSREINTTDPAYYKWTQWIFLQLFKKGLAYQSDEPINWCPSCLTGLANEDLNQDECERCGTTVEKKKLPQWVLKITAYADRMLHDLDQLQWPEHIKEAQRNWIGRSEGAEIDFALTDGTALKVFTTRPDTLFGATYMVVAPEHPIVGAHATAEVRRYVAQAQAKTEIERSGDKEKTGIELPRVRAINPATKQELPIYVADYVLWGYGTGAIMAVPAHDERDFEFAKKFNLPVVPVVEPLYIKRSGEDAVRSDRPMVERNAIIAVVRDPKTNNYLVLRWKGVAWTTFITGGIEKGQSAEEAARAEILQETGYSKLRLVKQLGTTHTQFFHVPKNENRYGHFTAFLFEIEENARASVPTEELAKHEPVWVDAAQAKAEFSAEAFLQLLDEAVEGERPYIGTGLLVNSGKFDGMSSEEAKKKITEFVGGKTAVTYKIKDWVFSRQRYWGEPIPIVHCPKDGAVAVPEDQLPVRLPEVESYEPSGTGESPLAAITEWVNTTCPACGGPGKRETNTMPQWAGSSWYYLRFMDPHNDTALVGKDKERYWAPVDVYVGGDHAVRHLIYARFWHKFLYDIGVVSTIEPFARLEFLGFILAPDGRKMSKRYGNTIDPTDVVKEVGADTFRLYEMFMGPFENTIAWNPASINGVARFVERVWRVGEALRRATPQERGKSSAEDFPTSGAVAPPDIPSGFSASLEPLLHQTIKKVGDDIEAFKFNTAVSQMMILLNAIEKEKAIDKEQWKKFLQLLHPFAPHITSELWERLGESGLLYQAGWPSFDESKLRTETVTVAVQVNGKVRATIALAPDAAQEAALAAARAAVGKWLMGPEKKAIYIPGKVINIVV